jgi:hypothetical protein
MAATLYLQKLLKSQTAITNPTEAKKIRYALKLGYSMKEFLPLQLIYFPIVQRINEKT